MITTQLEYQKENLTWTEIIGKIFIFLLISYWTYKLLFIPRPYIFLDNVNLLIHESGHLIFGFAGELIMLLGGTITQLLIPLLFGKYFLSNRKYFESLFCLFWLGDNLINVSTYIKDAQSMTLDLVGGGIHDWNAILTKVNLLNNNYIIGMFVFSLGILSLFVSFIFILAIIVVDISNKMNRNERV